MPGVLCRKVHGVPAGAVLVTRPGPWGNPFAIPWDGTRAEVVAKHAVWLLTQPRLLDRLPDLEGKDLVCVCADGLPCHGWTLFYFANPMRTWSMTKQDPANPDPGLLHSSARLELEEARKIILHATIVALESNAAVAATLGEREKEQIKRQIFGQPLEVLQRRIAAIGVQNPGCLAEAFRRAGYRITADGEGGIVINPDPESSDLIGRPVTQEEFEAL